MGDDSTLAQIIRLVERAMNSRSPIERAVDRVSRIFVPAVIALAIATFAFTWATHPDALGDSLMRAITVLVIACPCALGMATPLAITAAVGAASSRGILVSDSEALEKVHKIDTVILDKTGTVTEGGFELLQCRLASLADAVVPTFAEGTSAIQSSPRLHDDAEIFLTMWLSKLASIESCSEHPLGRAIVRFAEQNNASISEASDVKIHKGLGITGFVSGQRLFIGNRALTQQMGAPISNVLEDQASEWEREGNTVAFFGVSGGLFGILAFGDRIKPEAVRVVEGLRALGMRVMIVSGDAPATTSWVASKVSADDYVAEALPENKTDIISRLQQEGQFVAMIGDGVNDAPALAQADLGIAMGSGTDVAMRAAAFVLMSGSLERVLEAFELSRKARAVVRQNLFWAFLYNCLGISLAVTGVLNPILAAGAMLLSSLSVIGNSLRLTSSAVDKFATSQVEYPVAN